MQEITIHEKVYATIAILVVLVAGVFGLYALTHEQSTTPTTPVGGTGFALACTDTNGFSATTSPGYGNICGTSATTTQVYLGAGSNIATSTLVTVNTRNASSADINVYAAAASSSSSLLDFSLWASYNEVDWYPLPSGDVSGSLTFTPAFIASTTEIHLSNLNEPYLQLRGHGVTASSTVYAQVIPLNTVTQ
jgi:hypothetical protein